MIPLAYPVVVEPLTPEDGGGFLATAPDLPGCMSDGETPEEALRSVQEAIVEWSRGSSPAWARDPEAVPEGGLSV